MYTVNKVLNENSSWAMGFTLLVVNPKSVYISQNAFEYNLVVLMQESTFKFPVTLKRLRC